MDIQIYQADYNNPVHAQAIVELLDSYACDPMGGGTPLPEDVKKRVVKGLRRYPNAFTILANVDGEPAGLANCFEGFSSFKGRPLINIHDIAVHPKFRRLGLGLDMLEAVEEIALQRGCCKLTLEMLENNTVANNLYQKFGFSNYELDPKMGKAVFMEKPLTL